MKKTILSLMAVILLSATAMAQAVQKGYYRIQNNYSKRYIFLVDYHTNGVDWQAGTGDVDALRTHGDFSRVECDPATIYYIENHEGTQYNLKGQGKDVYQFVGYYLTITPVYGTDGKIHYQASGEYKGFKGTLGDNYEPNDIDFDPDFFGYLEINNSKALYRQNWDILPVSATDDSNYFGIKPELTVDGQSYAPFFASFPFTPVADGMKVYTVTKVDGNMAVYTEVQGTVAGGTPVIIACPGTTPSDNRINIEMQDVDKPANMLSGEYFDTHDLNLYNYSTKSIHYTITPWDAATMRILGTTSDGKLGFVKNTKLKAVPRNKAYLVVSADAPDEITLMTQAEYEDEKAKDAVTVMARSYSRQYGEANPAFEYDVTEGTLKGGLPQLTCDATATSPVGTYAIVVAQGDVTNPVFNAVNGTLTITEAPLTIKARSYAVNQGEELPVFEADYEGFKNGETADVLTKQPTFTCQLPETNPYPAGFYDIVVSGAEAQNYAISYVNGQLEIIETQGIAAVSVSIKQPADIYTLDGRCIRRGAVSTDGLPRGIYIVGGRKLVVR